MRGYLRVQLLAAGHLVSYLAALYFASGVHTGFKLDDNQLVGYVLCGVLGIWLGLSILPAGKAHPKLVAIGLLLGCFTLLGVTRLNWVSFNEAFWYFIFFVQGLPVLVLIETVGVLRRG